MNFGLSYAVRRMSEDLPKGTLMALLDLLLAMSEVTTKELEACDEDVAEAQSDTAEGE